MGRLIALLLSLASCEGARDNKPQKPNPSDIDLVTRFDIYSEHLRSIQDDFGAIRMGGSIGDALLFSCLAKAAGSIDFDIEKFMVDGKPARHPLYHADREAWEKLSCTFPAPQGKSSCTPISKDMVNGLMWCLYSEPDKAKAKRLTKSLIDYGKTTEQGFSWDFCSSEDKEKYSINDNDKLGRCLMTPSVVKDIYRLARHFDLPCDASCQKFIRIGGEVPIDQKDFQRHLAVLTTVRNGLIEGGITKEAKEIVLKNAKQDEMNALYQAAYALFDNGDMTDAIKALTSKYFPEDKIPDNTNYCTDYLFQRDMYRNNQLNADWLPCDKLNYNEGKGVDWVFAYLITSGKMNGGKSLDASKY